jgi:hypothetical protein
MFVTVAKTFNVSLPVDQGETVVCPDCNSQFDVRVKGTVHGSSVEFTPFGLGGGAGYDNARSNLRSTFHSQYDRLRLHAMAFALCPACKRPSREYESIRRAYRRRALVPWFGAIAVVLAIAALVVAEFVFGLLAFLVILIAR